jgi:integral membrane sensor domain MASE1
MIQTADERKVAPRGVGRYLAQIAIVFAVQFAAGKLAEVLPIVNSGGVGPVWPASGIALAAFLLFGYQVWPGVAAAAFLLTLLSPIPPVAAVAYGLGSTLAALSGAFLDDERRRIARELHDSVGQMLAALGMNLAVVGTEIERLTKIASTVNDSAALVQELSKGRL